MKERLTALICGCWLTHGLVDILTTRYVVHETGLGSESNPVVADLISSDVPFAFELTTIVVLSVLTVSSARIDGEFPRISRGLLSGLFALGIGIAANNTYWTMKAIFG